MGDLGFSLPRDDRQMTTRPGDIVLYGGDKIVLFHGSNSWSYTSLGSVEPNKAWNTALSADTIHIELEACHARQLRGR